MIRTQAGVAWATCDSWKSRQADKHKLLAVYPYSETGTMLKADTFALAKTKNPLRDGGFFCTTPAFTSLDDEPSIYPAWRQTQHFRWQN